MSGKKIQCKTEEEIYKEIYRRIHDTRPADCVRMEDHLRSLGICSSSYYHIKNFVEKKSLSDDRNKPMKEDSLRNLMASVGMDLIEPAYLVRM